MAANRQKGAKRAPPPVQGMVDPTQNVLNLVEALVQRQDDLREAERRLRNAESTRQDDLREAERRLREASTGHTKEIALMIADHARELRLAEAKRIDAIRETDTTALTRQQQVSSEAASALALQVVESADTLRKQVADTASAAATQLSTALKPLQHDIDVLRSFRSEQFGAHAQVTETKGDSRAGQASIGLWIGIGVSALIGLMGTLIALAGLIYAVTR